MYNFAHALLYLRSAAGTNFGSAVGFDALHALQRLSFTRAVDGSGSLLNYLAMLIEEEEQQEEPTSSTSASGDGSGGGSGSGVAQASVALGGKVSLMTSLRRLEEAMALASRTPIMQIEGDLNLLRKACTKVGNVVRTVKREKEMRNKRKEMIRSKVQRAEVAEAEAEAQGKNVPPPLKLKPVEEVLLAEADLNPEADPFVVRIGAFHRAAEDTLVLLQSELEATVRLFAKVRIAMGVGEWDSTDEEAKLRTGGGGAGGEGSKYSAASNAAMAEEDAKAPKVRMAPEKLFTRMGKVLKTLRSAVQENRDRKKLGALRVQQEAQKIALQRKRRDARARARDRRVLELLAVAPASSSKRAAQYNNPLPNSHWMQLQAQRHLISGSVSSGEGRKASRFGSSAGARARARARAGELDDDADENGGGVSEMKRMVEARRQRAKEGKLWGETAGEAAVQQTDGDSASVYNSIPQASAPQSLGGFLAGVQLAGVQLDGVQLRSVETLRSVEAPESVSIPEVDVEGSGEGGDEATSAANDATSAAPMADAATENGNASAPAAAAAATAAATAVALADGANEQDYHTFGELKIGYSVGEAWTRVRGETTSNWLLLRWVYLMIASTQRVALPSNTQFSLHVLLLIMIQVCGQEVPAVGRACRGHRRHG
jgi:hypothetical protein